MQLPIKENGFLFDVATGPTPPTLHDWIVVFHTKDQLPGAFAGPQRRPTLSAVYRAIAPAPRHEGREGD